MRYTTKIAVSAALIVAASSAALAKRVDPSLAGMSAPTWSEQQDTRQHQWSRAMHLTISGYTCPVLEGYPDCRS